MCVCVCVCVCVRERDAKKETAIKNTKNRKISAAAAGAVVKTDR